MKLIVNPHKIEIEKTPINEREIDITKCEFEFADEITNDYVKEAYFTFDGTTYKQIIVNNQCDIPNEVLAKKGQVEIGVVAFLVENDEEIKRYNPSPAYFNTWQGSLKDNVENSEPITPSDKEQIESQILNLQNGKINISDIIDNLTSTLTGQPLSANQGKVLKELIDINGSDIDDINSSISYLGDTLETKANISDVSSTYETIVEHNSDIIALNEKINGVASGSPLPVSSVSEMIDTSKIYVNTTDGNWYYYNGTNWVVGGVYQSTGISDLSIGYSKVKNDINVDNNIETEWINGGICSENNVEGEGTIIDDSSLKRSKPILLKKGMIIFVDTIISNQYNSISKVDAGNNFISTIKIGSGKKTYYYKATENIEYLCVTRNTGDFCYITIYDENYNITPSFNIGGYVASSTNTTFSEGTITNSHPWSSTPVNNRYVRTNLIKLSKGNVLKIKASSPSTINVISVFDNDLNYVSGVSGIGSNKLHDYNYVADNDCYVIISNDITYTSNPSAILYNSKDDYIQDDITWNYFYVLDNNVTTTSGTNYDTTNEIFLNKGDVIDFYVRSSTDNAYILSIWKNGVNTSGIKINNSSTSSDFYRKSNRSCYVAPEDCFVRITDRVDLVSLANTQINVFRYNDIKDSNIYNKIVSVIGDSYVANQNSNIGQTWHSQVASKYGATYNNYGINGNGLVTTDGSGTPVINRLDTIDANSDLVIVIGGKNDYNEQLPINDFKAGIDTICQDLITSFYNKKIVFFTPWNSYGTNDTRTIKLEDYVNAIKEECSKYSIPVYDSFHDSNMYMWDTNFRTAFCQSSTDMSHLNKEGHKRFLNQAEKFIISL